MTNIKEDELTKYLSEKVEKLVRDGMRFGAKQEREKIAMFPFSIDEPVSELCNYIKQYGLEQRLEELEGCYEAVNSLDVEDHTNVVYNPYIDHHNKRLAKLTAPKEHGDTDVGKIK